MSPKVEWDTYCTQKEMQVRQWANQLVGSQRRGKGEEMDALTALDAQRLASNSGGRKTSPRRRRSRNRVRNRRFALGEMDSIDDKMFKRMFRMSKHAFSNLLGLLEDHYEERDSASVRQAKTAADQSSALKRHWPSLWDGLRARLTLIYASLGESRWDRSS